MTGTDQINVPLLLETAQSSPHKEAYIVLETSPSYRIGVGVRLPSSNHPSFFIEVIIQLCLNSSQVDLSLLEKKMTFLKELEKRNYFLTCQDDHSIWGEITISPKNLATEYETINSIVKRIFSSSI